MSDPIPPSTRALRGFLVGFLLIGGIAFGRTLWQGHDLGDDLVSNLALATMAGVLFAIGKGVCDQITGSVLGGVAFCFLGTLFGYSLPVSLGTVEISPGPRPPSELPL